MVDKNELESVNSNGVEGLKAKSMRKSIPNWIYVAIGTVLYGSIWSYIGILKILSLNAYVFDLGINSERGWQILHTNLGLYGYFTTIINSGIVFPLSPLTGSGNFFAMIIFQAFSIAIVGPLIYLIAKRKGLGSRESTMLPFAFFLYFPVYGIMWFDFHYQVFFLPLFMLAYLTYLKENYALSFVLFSLSGMVRYPYSIFPMAFALIELSLVLLNGSYYRNIRRTFFMLILLILMIIWTLLGFLISGISGTIPHTNISQYIITTSSLWSRILVLLLFLTPLLFLPVLRLRWIILTFPAFYLFLFSSYTWYVYPHVFQGQYTAGVVPFLLLGFIDFLALSAKTKNDKKEKLNKAKFFSKHISVKRSVVAIILMLLILNMFFAPFSPLNNQFGDQFNFKQNTAYNPQQYSELSSMLKLIPSSDPYVLYQNNIPEILPLHIPPGGAILMGGYLGSFINVSMNEAINNSWQVNSNGNIMSLPLNFALADASNINFYLSNNSDYSIIHNMYLSGNYGILSEGCGLILLKFGYNGTVENYIPENVSIPGSHFSKFPPIYQLSIGSNFSNNSGKIITYAGNPLYLFPGLFTVTLYLNSHFSLNTSFNNTIVLRVYSGSQILSSEEENNFSSIKNLGIQEVKFSVALNSIEGNVWYSLSLDGHYSNISVSKMVVSQSQYYQHYQVD